MCGRGTHSSNHLCIARLSGSVRCQLQQWWYHYSKHYPDLCQRKWKTIKGKPCLQRFCHQAEMLFLLYFPFLRRENTLWSRQSEKNYVQVPKHSFVLFCDTISCKTVRIGSVNILKDILLMSWNSVTQWEAEFSQYRKTTNNNLHGYNVKLFICV